MKYWFAQILQFLARLTLLKYQPTIVGITGSVGKTSTKEAVYAVLASKFSAREAPKNYNNEMGVPFAILGVRAPGRSLLRWGVLFARALWLIVWPTRYPAILVLEMGADHPKDILKLVKLAPPKVGVVTAVSPAHTEFFGNVKRVAVEKRRLVEAVPKEGTVVLNMDDDIVAGFFEYAEGKVIGYGVKGVGEVQAVEIVEQVEEMTRIATDRVTDQPRMVELGSVHFKILVDGSAVPVHLPNVLGMSHVYAALAASAVGRAFGMHMVEISNALLKYAPPPGRMRLVSGVKGTLLIDDTYNSSPRAAISALETFGRLTLAGENTRYAVLGDMLELGTLTEAAHREVGRVAAQHADVLLAVGASAAWMVEEAQKNGMSPDRAFHFHTREEVEHFLQERIKPGDVLLIKGSQGMRMERLVKGLMAEPLRAGELLCRQDKEWH